MDAAPHVEGHTLVIPKKHYRWVWDVPMADSYFSLVTRIARHYQEVTGSDYVASFVAGNQVPHAHIHILPNPQGLDINLPKLKLTERKGRKLVQKLALKAEAGGFSVDKKDDL